MNVNSVPMLSIIILTWNSEKYLMGCFNSILSKSFEEKVLSEIIVIDNGSVDGTCDIINKYKNEHPEVFTLIKLDSNMGTTYPRNLGLKKARGNYICVLDSDTELVVGSLLTVFSRLLDERVGILVPQLLLPNGEIQNSVKLYPTMLNKLMKIPRIILGLATKNNDFYENFPFNEEQVVNTAISACWFFKKELLEKIGYLDENIFYAPEDLDYSRRVWLGGLSILYYPGFTVLHHTQQITHKKPLSKTSLSHFRGLVYYYCKHGGWLIRPKV